jgi:hypothetical protein
MFLQNGPDAIIRIGLIFLVLGSLSLRLASHTNLSVNAADAVTGFLYGAAIACLLMGIGKKSRPTNTCVR